MKGIMSLSFMKECSHHFFLAYEYIINLDGSEVVDYNHLIGIFQKSRQTLVMKKQGSIRLTRSRRNSEADLYSLKKPLELIAEKYIEISPSMEKYPTFDISQSKSNVNFSIMPQDNIQDLYNFVTKTLLESNRSIEEKSTSCVSEESGLQIKIQSTFKFKNPFLSRNAELGILG